MTDDNEPSGVSNVIQFPNNLVTVEELLTKLTEAVKAGEVQYLMFATMSYETEVKVAMTTTPAHCAMYMNHMQRLSVEELIRDKGMIP